MAGEDDGPPLSPEEAVEEDEEVPEELVEEEEPGELVVAGEDDGPPLSPEEAVEEDEEVPEELVEEEEPGELVVAGEDDGPPLSPEEAVEEEEEVAVEAADAMSADSATTTLDIAIIWLGNRFVEIMVNQGDNAKDYFSALLTTFRRAGEVRN